MTKNLLTYGVSTTIRYRCFETDVSKGIEEYVFAGAVKGLSPVSGRDLGGGPSRKLVNAKYRYHGGGAVHFSAAGWIVDIEIGDLATRSCRQRACSVE